MQELPNEEMAIKLQKYVQRLISKYPYWNRTLGADHFFVNCHNVGVIATEGSVLLLMKNAIQLVCSPTFDSEFNTHKDISLIQVHQTFAPPHHGNDTVNR
jgi:hypothetical protein